MAEKYNFNNLASMGSTASDKDGGYNPYINRKVYVEDTMHNGSMVNTEGIDFDDGRSPRVHIPVDTNENIVATGKAVQDNILEGIHNL